MKINTIEDVVKIVDGKECLIVRDVNKNEGKDHWIENYENLKEGDEPKIMPITEDLFLDCFNTDYFTLDKGSSNAGIFYLEFNKAFYNFYLENSEED